MLLFDGEIFVEYGYVFVLPQGTEQPELRATRGGQANGLCGVALPGVLSLVVALSTGWVPLRVELLDTAPPVDGGWEEVVEASLSVARSDVMLLAFDSHVELPAVPPGSYRVRYSASGMTAAHDMVRSEGGPVMDRYLLQLWPAPPRPDAVLRQTSPVALYWHREAAATPPAPSPERPPGSSAVQEAGEEDLERGQWGGGRPTQRMRELGVRGAELARQDRPLLESILVQPPQVQRRLALQVARWSCGQSGLDRLDWVAEGLAALAAGEPLPPPLDVPDRARRRLVPGPVPGPAVAEAPGPELPAPGLLTRDGQLRAGQQAAALDVLLSAADRDPARAAVGAVVAAWGAVAEPATLLRDVHRLLAGGR